MGYNSNEKKKEVLGIAYGTARNRLIKQLLWKFIQDNNQDICFQCNNKIETIEELSIEHKIPWQVSDSPVELFFDLNNIAYSHCSCNYAAATKSNAKDCGDRLSPKTGCYCNSCKTLEKELGKSYRDSLPKEIRQERRRIKYQKEKLKRV